MGFRFLGWLLALVGKKLINSKRGENRVVLMYDSCNNTYVVFRFLFFGK